MACGARWDEHEERDGPCTRTKCKGFSDPYYALHVGMPPLASFCRKTYKLLINQEKPIIQDQTSDKLERRSGCGFPARRRSGESNCSLPSRSGLVGKLRVAGQRAEPPDWELNRKFSEGSDSGLSR